MILAIDSSVILGILKDRERYRPWAEYILDLHARAQLVICDVVYAEIAGLYRDASELHQMLQMLGLDYDPIGPDAAFLAGQIYLDYRHRGGPRTSLIPDFLIGAHAMRQAHGLLTTDRGYLRGYFSDLQTFAPGA